MIPGETIMVNNKKYAKFSYHRKKLAGLNSDQLSDIECIRKLLSDAYYSGYNRGYIVGRIYGKRRSGYEDYES